MSVSRRRAASLLAVALVLVLTVLLADGAYAHAGDGSVQRARLPWVDGSVRELRRGWGGDGPCPSSSGTGHCPGTSNEYAVDWGNFGQEFLVAAVAEGPVSRASAISALGYRSAGRI